MVEIHISADTLKITTEAVHNVLMFGSYEHVYQQVPQTTLDGAFRAEFEDHQYGTVCLSRKKVMVTLRARDGRLYVINADAFRDVMHGKIPRATVSEVVYTRSKGKKTSILA